MASAVFHSKDDWLKCYCFNVLEKMRDCYKVLREYVYVLTHSSYPN